jgi:hypothetical protein
MERMAIFHQFIFIFIFIFILQRNEAMALVWPYRKAA